MRLTDHVLDKFGRGKIQMRCRLVQKQDLGPGRQRPDKCQLLLLAARQGARWRVDPVRDA